MKCESIYNISESPPYIDVIKREQKRGDGILYRLKEETATEGASKHIGKIQNKKQKGMSRNENFLSLKTDLQFSQSLHSSPSCFP